MPRDIDGPYSLKTSSGGMILYAGVHSTGGGLSSNYNYILQHHILLLRTWLAVLGAIIPNRTIKITNNAPVLVWSLHLLSNWLRVKPLSFATPSARKMGKQVWPSPDVMEKMGAKDALCKVATMNIGHLEDADRSSSTANKEDGGTGVWRLKGVKEG